MAKHVWVVGLLAGALAVPAAGVAQERAAVKTPDSAGVIKQIVAATNQFRREENRRELKVNPELSKAAQAFAEFMARTDKFSHEADGKKPAERVAAAKYDYCIVAENIGYEFSSAGFTTEELAKGLMDGWKKSPPHRKNLLDPDLYDIGVGLARSSQSGKYYAVQDFGRPKSKEIEFKITNRTGDTVKYTLEGKTFSVEPRYTVTHRMCRPADLKIQQPGNATAEVLHPGNGASYVIRKDDTGKYQVNKE